MRNAVSWTLNWTWLVAALFAAAPVTAAGEPEKWDFVDKDEGIYVWKHDVPGHQVPDFRGQTFIEASIEQVLNEMLDWKKHTEWMYACAESTLLTQQDTEHMTMYNRIDAPWPVWDRDVIANIAIEKDPGGKYVKVSFQNISSALRPVPKRVVRLPKLVGFYKLWQVEPNKTKIIYQVEAEMGGSIPRWLAVAGARDLPHYTLEALRSRVESTKAKKK
jgi:hypothetical protein